MNHLVAYCIYFVVVAMAVVFARRHPKGPNSRTGFFVVFCGALVGAALITWSTDTPWFGDYQSAYYPAGKLIFRSPSLLYGGQCAFGFVNLPLVAVPFVPFTLFRYWVAVALFTALGLGMVIISTRSLTAWSGATRNAAGSLIALVVVNGPLWYSVREGNSTHIVLLLLVAALYALRSGREIGAGALLGLAAVVKLPLILFIGYFAARFRYRALLGFVVAVALIVFISLLVHGLPLHRLWVEQCIIPYAGKPIAGFNAQSLTGFLARLYGGNPYSWTPVLIGGSFKLVRQLLSAILVIVVAGLFLRSGKPRRATEITVEFTAFLTFILLFSPLSWTHYFLFLLIPLAFLLSGDIPLPRGRFWMVFFAVTVLLCCLPLRGFGVDMSDFRFFYARFFASHHFYGGLMLLIILLRVRLEQSETQADRGNNHMVT